VLGDLQLAVRIVSYQVDFDWAYGIVVRLLTQECMLVNGAPL